MKRSYNYTGRTKLKVRDFTISLYEMVNTLEFSLDLSNQEDYSIAGKASVIVEAYVGANTERFVLGSWANFRNKVRVPITLFSVEDTVKFRIKIVDRNTDKNPLLAWKDSISPVEYDSKGAKRTGILPIRATDLGSLLWRVFWVDEYTPRLEVNKRVSETKDINAIVRGDSDFAALVFPAVLTEILLTLLKNNNLDEEDSPWCVFALKYTNELPPFYEDNADAREKAEEWVSDIVEKFSNQFELLSKYKKFKTNN